MKKVLTAEEVLSELETHLGVAATSLRDAWFLCKQNGLEATAKELADTVLDVETAKNQVSCNSGHRT